MKNKVIWYCLSSLILSAILLAACTTTTATSTQTQTLTTTTIVTSTVSTTTQTTAQPTETTTTTTTQTTTEPPILTDNSRLTVDYLNSLYESGSRIVFSVFEDGGYTYILMGGQVRQIRGRELTIGVGNETLIMFIDESIKVLPIYADSKEEAEKTQYRSIA